MRNQKKEKSFSLIELIIVIAIIFILGLISLFNFRFLRNQNILDEASEQLLNILRIAQSKTLACEGDSQWGVFFNTSTQPHQYILFKGPDYSSRNASFDEIYELPKIVEFSEIDLWAGKEITFKKITGFVSTTDDFDKISLRLKNDISKERIIFINRSGQINLY